MSITGTIKNSNGWDVAYYDDIVGTNLLDFERQSNAATFSITAISRVAGQDIILTAVGHPLFTGSLLIATQAAQANGTWTVTVIDADTFSLDGSSGTTIPPVSLGGTGIATYDAKNGINGWNVKISGDSVSDQTIYVNYNQTVSIDPTNPPGVWGSAVAVYHFPFLYPITSGGLNKVPDSTGHGFDLTQTSNVLIQAPGQLEQGLSAQNSAGDGLQNDSFPDMFFGAQPWSVISWFNTSLAAGGSPIFICIDPVTSRNVNLQVLVTGGVLYPQLKFGGIAVYDVVSVTAPPDTWCMVAFTMGGDGVSATAYLGVPGVGVGSHAFTLSGTFPDHATDMLLARSGADSRGEFQDETTVWASQLSGAFIQALFNNQSDPTGATYITVGPETAGTNGYLHKRAITISHTMFPSNLPDFPLFLQLDFPLESAPPLTLTCASSNASRGTAYLSALVAAGGTPSYTYAIAAGALPPGLALNTVTGVISGTPAAIGTYAYTGRVTDASSVITDTSCAITVTPSSTAPGGTPISLIQSFGILILPDNRRLCCWGAPNCNTPGGKMLADSTMITY